MDYQLQVFLQYLMKLEQHLLSQNKRVDQLEKTCRFLEEQLEELKNKPYTNIEKIEYKFDQLKVEKLEGVLNIGLNPNDPSAIDQFEVQNDQVEANDFLRELKKQIYEQCREKIENYLKEECPKKIKELSENNQLSLDDTYAALMIEDIRRQIDGRLAYYIEHLRLHDQTDVQEKVQLINQQVKKDIEQSIAHFLKHFPNQKKGEDFS